MPTHEESKIATIYLTLRDLVNTIVSEHAEKISTAPEQHSFEENTQCAVCKQIWYALKILAKLEDEVKGTLKIAMAEHETRRHVN